MTACASMAPPQPPSLDLPRPPADLRASRKGDKVNLLWTIPNSTTDRRAIRALGLTRICRGADAHLADCGKEAGSMPAPGVVAKSAKRTASFTDSLPVTLLSDSPGGFVAYAVEVLNSDGRDAGLSNQARVSSIRTLPPPQDFRAQLTGQGVKLSWNGGSLPKNSSSSVRYVNRVFRRHEDSAESTLVGSVPVTGESNLILMDSNIEWEKTYEYRAETVTVVRELGTAELQVEGDDSPEVKVFTHDVFPPAAPAGLQAVFSGPGQEPFVDLIWTPVSDVDLDGYNVYRREEGTSPVRLNAQLVKVPAFRDTGVVAGHRYFYSVSAVDVRGNESARSVDSDERVPLN